MGSQRATSRLVPCLGLALALKGKNRIIEGIGSGRMISGPYPTPKYVFAIEARVKSIFYSSVS